MRGAIFALLLAVAIGLVASPTGASAQAPQPTFSATVENRYPGSIAFNLSAEASSAISEAALHYSIIGRGASAVSRPEIEEPASTVEASVEVPTNSQDTFIPVGSEFLYYWQITLADGSVSIGEEGTFLYLPPDRDWQTVSNYFMEVYYHGDRSALASGYLAAAEETYETMGALLAAELSQLPVRVILFADESEMSPARPGRGETFDAAVTTCGTRVAVDIVYVIPVSCGSGDQTDTLRHEFTHILTAEAGETALVKMPAWLDEGTAVSAQSVPGDNYVGAFNSAVQADRLIPFIQMSTATDRSSQVNLFYGQSFAMVNYLIEREGPEVFAQMFALAKSGNRFETALEEVYGIDLPAFEAEFRQNYGLPASQSQPTQPAPTQPASQDPDPTVTEEPVEHGATSGDDGNGISTTTLGIVGVAVVFALVAVFFYLASFMLQARRTPAGPSGESPPAPPRYRDPDDDPDDRWGPPS